MLSVGSPARHCSLRNWTTRSLKRAIPKMMTTMTTTMRKTLVTRKKSLLKRYVVPYRFIAQYMLTLFRTMVQSLSRRQLNASKARWVSCHA
jgi:hypothetical protein